MKIYETSMNLEGEVGYCFPLICPLNYSEYYQYKRNNKVTAKFNLFITHLLLYFIVKVLLFEISPGTELIEKSKCSHSEFQIVAEPPTKQYNDIGVKYLRLSP